MRNDHKDTEPHTVVIHAIHPDEEGVVDWDIKHPNCRLEYEENDLGEYTYYECLVQAIFDNIGLADALEDFKPLKVGEYKVVGCSTYDDYTHESDTWLESYDG